MSSQSRVTRGSQGSPESILNTPTPAVGSRVPRTMNPPKIGGGKKKAGTTLALEKPKRVQRKVVPSVLHGVQDFMSALPQDLIKELKQSIRKGQWEAVAAEFMRKCAWRLRHFSQEELRKIAGNITPSGSIVSVEQAVDFLSEIQSEIQSGIAMAHETAARLFMCTSAGHEYLEYAKKTKKRKHAIKQVELHVLEEVLAITDMELMGFWTPIVSSAKSTYWEHSTGGRSVLLAMKRISYEIISRFIGAMKSWNEAEIELTFSVRQIVLQATSSLKSPAFWPDPPGPYPVGAAKWETMSIMIECPGDSPDFKSFEERFRAQQGPRYLSASTQDEGDSQNEGEGEGEEDGQQEVSDTDSEDIYSAPKAVIAAKPNPTTATAKPNPTTATAKPRGGKLMVEDKIGAAIQALGNPGARTGKARVGRSGSVSTPTLGGETPGSVSSSGAPIDLDCEDYGVIKNHYEEVVISAENSVCDLEESAEKECPVKKYGGYPTIIKTSTRMNVAGAEEVDEEMYQEFEKLDESERKEMEAAHPWIKIEDGSEYVGEGAERFGRMGPVARAAYDLAAVNSINMEYERVIVKCLAKQERNRELMKDLEKARKKAVDNEKLYNQAMLGYRQTERELMEGKKTSLALAAKPMPAYLSAATEVKKRKVVVEDKSGAIFGTKPINKKLRINAKGAPLAENPNTASGEREGIESESATSLLVEGGEGYVATQSETGGTDAVGTDAVEVDD